jgi:hypothetical protein
MLWIMEALKPWHAIIVMLCCLLPATAAVAGGVWAVRRSRARR